MHIDDTPERLIDQTDGEPVERIYPKASRFEQIEVKAGENEVIVKAQEVGTEDITTVEFPMVQKLFRGVIPEDGRRRDVDDDILDVLHLVGYCVNDRDSTIKRY